MKTSSIDASLVLALVLSGVGFHPTQSAAGVEGFTTNLPAGLSAIPTVRAVAAPAQVIAAVPSSLPASNGPAIADLGVGASSVVLREIRLLKDGAVADYGLQKVLFPADIAESPLTILTPDGRKLACRAAFLALHDSASGQSFLLGEVRSSIGQLVGDNTVVYPDAFDTVRADVRYRYTGHSLEQDIILCEAVKLPGGFESGNARLEVWSEWVDSAPDARESLTLDLRPGAAGGVAVADEQLKFGAMRIGDGHAFGLQSEGDRTPVAKTFARIEGRDWLIERVDYTALKSALDKLPRPQAGLSPDRLKSDRSGLVRSLQARSGARPAGRIKRMAAVQPPDRDGLVLDFVIVSSVPLPAGVVSWWPAGGNANDAIIASGNNGTWVGAAAYTAGKVGQGFSFDGNNHLSVAHSASLSPTTGLTIEGWVWTPSGASGTRIIAFKGSFTNGEIQYAFYLDDPNLVYAQVEASYYAVSGSGLAAEAWNHVAMTYDTAGKTLTLFINGQPETPVTIADGLVPTPEPLRIGNSGDGNDPYPFVGQMDELTLYNRALAGSEVQSIYNAGAAGKNNPNCATAPADIVAWWPGDGNGYDLARTNHATLSGATYVSAVASQGFNFDGLNDGVAAANDNALNLATATDQLTLEAWIKPLANNNTYGVMSVVGKRYSPNSSTATGYELFLVNGVPGFQIANASGVANFIATGDLRDGGWHHVAVTLDRASTTGGTIYVDGTPRLTFNPTVIAGSLSNAVPVRIGTHPQPGFNGWYKGVIDEVTFYRRALTNIEITALYSAGSAGKCKVDTDGDGLTDLQEAFLGTNPNLADTDGDGMDDGWEWDHFGSFGRGGSGDYDSDGVSDLDEYTAGSDPNTITFETHYPNLNVSNRTVTGSCATATGVPAQMTVLVNSTNWPAAVWSPYNSNFTVTLPNQDSNHMVLVALRGRARDATVVWDETEITLDRVPPVLVVTNPATPTVSKPYLQLQGYANEALATLTYDLTNAFGLVTNELVAVVDQFFDTNRFDFTTNYFQGYDLALAPSSNRITLRVTDLAGNVTTTNLWVTLDYTTATNPPGLEVVWPTNGMHPSGDNFYVRGNINDETASVVAEWVDANGVTNVVSGLVERNGMFWVEGLPLEVGTNEVLLIATAAAGQVSSTNLSVVKSEVNLTIDSTPEGESLYDPFGTVTGTVSDPDYTVAVNGKSATVDAAGYWTAVDVPVQGRGTATFDAVAAQAGGSAPPVATSVAPELPAMIVIMKHFSKYTSRAQYAGQSGTQVRTKNYDAQFAPGMDGQWRRSYQATVTNDNTVGVSSSHTDYHWSHTNTAGTQHAVSDGVDYPTTPMDGTYNNDVLVKYLPDKSLDHEEYTPGYNTPVRYLVTHLRAAGVKHRWAYPGGDYYEETLKARTDLKLFTGGKAKVARRNLLCLDVWAEEIGRPAGFPWYQTFGTAVAANRIQLLGQSPGNDGKLWLALPDNSDRSLNLRVPSARHINAEVQPTKHKLRIVVNGSCPLAEDRVVPCAANYWVGQRLEFTPAWIPAISGVASKTVQWEFSGNYVNDSWQHFWMPPAPSTTPVYYGSVNYFKNPDLLTQEDTHGWWVSGKYEPPEEFHAHIGEHLTFNNGQQAVVTAIGKFNMRQPLLMDKHMCQDRDYPPPDFSPMHSPPLYPCLSVEDGTHAPGVVTLGHYHGGYARFWASFKSRPGDNFVELQIVKSYRQWGNNAPVGSGTEWWFDSEGKKSGGISPAGADGVGIVQQTDQYPGILKEAPGFHLSDTFKTYMRYTPQEAGSIAVTLGRVDWSWAVDGQYANGQWSVIPGTILEPTWHEDDGFPEFIGVAPNH